MKKTLLVTTIAALSTTVAHATTYDVSSNITGVKLFIGTEDLLQPGLAGYFTGFKFGGTAIDADNNGTIDGAALTLVGEAGFNLPPPIKFTFNLGSGNYAHSSGTTFSSGTVQADTLANVNYGISDTVDYQWVPFSTVDASTTNLLFLAGQPGHLIIRDPDTGEIINQLNTTAGLSLVPGTHALPGLWDGQFDGEGVNSSLGHFMFSGYDTGVFMQGTITLTPQAVPLPPALWLFGSSLVGLVGAKRKFLILKK